MKLAFSGEGRYPDYDEGYELYVNRLRSTGCVDKKTYAKIIKMYCKHLALMLEKNGTVDLPSQLGMISAMEITRRPQYRGDKFIGFGGRDWKNSGVYDGEMRTFGIVYMPRRGKVNNLRCFGFVANRRLFKRIKEKYMSGDSKFILPAFSNNMI